MTAQTSRRALQQLRLWALFVFFLSPITHGLMGDPHAGDSRSARALDGGNEDCIIWTINRFDERYPLLSVAGQSIRHRKVIRTTMSCAVVGMLVLSAALWFTSAVLFAVGLAIFGASFGSSGSGD